MKRGVLSRAFNYIFKGVPVINMTAEITTITNGKLFFLKSDKHIYISRDTQTNKNGMDNS